MKPGRSFENARPDERGGVLVAALLTITVLIGLSGVVLRQGISHERERSSSQDDVRALYLAEAGVNDALARLASGDTTDVGTADQQESLSNGSYWADLSDNGDGTFTVVSSGTARGRTRAVEAVLAPLGGGVYSHALFAGNRSGDPLYTMRFGGDAGQADQIRGDIFSGGHVLMDGDSEVHGTIRATGTILGASGEQGVTQPLPDLAAMDYENTADFDVADLFASGGAQYQRDNAGGYAWQLPESNAAHIFRKNPSDRSSDVNSTPQDDYFLEDPYEPVNADSNADGSNPFMVTTTPDGNGKVYYIDGNLWIHNKQVFSFGFADDGGQDLKITFVVKGNVYFSDNIFYGQPEHDGIAFIAMEDPQYGDSTGNIYFGDPEFGTLESMDAFMYAQNNFYDNNLSATGSARVHVNGNMTAGNQVAINRDFGDQHSRLTVDFDDRISSGALDMPGIPGSVGGDAVGYTVVSWREVAAP